MEIFNTYQHCFDVAKRYTKYTDFRKLAQSIYITAFKHNWLKDYTWLHKNDTNHWDKESIKKVASTCSCATEFKKKYRGALKAAYRLGIYKELTFTGKIVHTNIDLNQTIWLVYVYELYNSVYIGLTKNIKRRDYEHCCRPKDQLHKYCIENNIELSRNSYIIKKDNLTALEALYYEDLIKLEYKNLGWNIINKGVTGINSGSLGSINIKWTLDTCYEEAKKYSRKVDFKKGSPRAYTVSNMNHWMNNYHWFN